MEWKLQGTPPLWLIQDIEDIIKGCRKLKHLSLGFSEELLAYSSSLVEQLSTRHARHLEALHLASVKEDSETYGIVDLNVEQLKTFSNLKHLSIDYDHVDSKLLEGLSLGRETALQSLVIHIHGVDPEHEIIPNSRWQQFSNCNQNVEVTLNLVHSYIAVNNLLNILKPSLPLAHYRQFFCSKINNAALGLMANHYSRCLKSVYIIDGYEEDFPVAYDSATNEDPFVMLAWKCLHLNSFSLIGYEIMDEDVIAIARLRSQSLKQLHIPHGCIVDGKTLTVGQPSLEFSDMISATLCRPWRPLYNEELPMVVFDEFADAEEAYNNIFLDDQKYRKA